MKGHEHIIQMRLAGKKPEAVFLEDHPCETDWHEHGDHATVCIAGDNIETLDLRFLVGTVVLAGSRSEKRAQALFKAVLAVSPMAVVCHHSQADKKPWEQDGWIGTYYHPEYLKKHGKHHS